MMSRASNIYRLGIKELWSLVRDPMMLVLIVTVGAFSTFLYKVMFAREIATARFMKKLPSVPMSAEVQEKLDSIISKELEDESIDRMLDEWRYR